MSNKSNAIQATLYRHGAAHVDVKIRPSAWFATVRVWRGERWPDLERTWYARVRGWIPWFSLERQVWKAVAYLAQARTTYLTAQEVGATLERVRRDLHRSRGAS